MPPYQHDCSISLLSHRSCRSTRLCAAQRGTFPVSCACCIGPATGTRAQRSTGGCPSTACRSVRQLSLQGWRRPSKGPSALQCASTAQLPVRRACRGPPQACAALVCLPGAGLRELPLKQELPLHTQATRWPCRRRRLRCAAHGPRARQRRGCRRSFTDAGAGCWAGGRVCVCVEVAHVSIQAAGQLAGGKRAFAGGGSMTAHRGGPVLHTAGPLLCTCDMSGVCDRSGCI